jgi:hypothetical protein
MCGLANKLGSPCEKQASTPNKGHTLSAPPNDVQGQPLGRHLKRDKQGYRKAALSWYVKRQSLDDC